MIRVGGLWRNICCGCLRSFIGYVRCVIVMLRELVWGCLLFVVWGSWLGLRWCCVCGLDVVLWWFCMVCWWLLCKFFFVVMIFCRLVCLLVCGCVWWKMIVMFCVLFWCCLNVGVVWFRWKLRWMVGELIVIFWLLIMILVFMFLVLSVLSGYGGNVERWYWCWWLVVMILSVFRLVLKILILFCFLSWCVLWNCVLFCVFCVSVWRLLVMYFEVR